MTKRLKLFFRLMKDKRISPFLKIIPFLSLIYLVFPEMLLGPVDDAVVMGLSIEIFMALVPKYILEEHEQALEDVIEGEYRDL